MVNKKGKGAKTKGSKPPVKKPLQDANKDLTQQSPQERVSLVRPFWETLEQDERVKLLTIDLDGVRARAKQLAEAARQQAVADAPEGEPLDPSLLELEPSIEDVLEEGIKRLKEKGTWKVWQWPTDNATMYDAESFRQHITEKHVREELRRLLPRDEGRATEKPAEAAFRQRMLDLMTKVQQSTNANSLRPNIAGSSGEDGAARPHRRRGDPGSHLRDSNIELLAVLLEALAKENDNLYHSLLTPITTFVMEILPEGHRETTKTELSFEDLENLMPDDVSRIVEWLTEKVDALSTKLKPEPKEEEEEEEENMGDVDLWSLADENHSLAVNAKWLQHLQDRLLGEDGHPRRAKAGEDPGRNGLVLEWVYGSIVSTAEKARDGSKRCLGMQPPSAADAHMVLVRALDEHLAWETRAKQCKDLLSEMLKSRLEAAELGKQGYDLRPLPKRDLPGISGELGQGSSAPLLLEEGASGLGLAAAADKPLPDEVILFMLRREALLTRAKLHFLVFEHLTQEKELRILKQALRQGEPEFERLKRELDEVKHQARSMEGAYRSAAEMERHRHQLEIQTAFREQGARLQATYDKKQKAEYDMAKRETEIKQLQGWKGTVENLVEKFQELINCRNERLQAANLGPDGTPSKEGHEAEGDLEAVSSSLTPQQHLQLTKMRNHFAKDVRKQLYGEPDDRTFFDNLKTALKAIERRLEDSSVALQHLEMQLINVACDDPGAIIGTQLALPLLQDRLDQRGLEYAAKRAKLAEDEVLRMELLAAEREAAERERKKAAKAKKNEKAKSEKERLAAERQAKEQAERVARQEAERERAVRDEEERRKRLEAVEAMRKAEEVAIELRRKELLSDENGYWRQRMIMEERLSGMAVGTGNGGRNAPDVAEEQDRQGSSSPEDVRRAGDDDEGFITENRRRRHKDTRDQDDDVPTPASAAPGTGARGANALRSGSRDRMGPRDAAGQRERGEHPHRGRDREPRRHHAPANSSSSAHRSGSREGNGRQGTPQGGASAGPPAQRPPSVPRPVPVPSGSIADGPADDQSAASTLQAEMTSVPPPVLASVEAGSSPAPAPKADVSAESTELPAPPASGSPAGPTSPDASAVPAGAAIVTLPSPEPSGGCMPEDAILFGDIAVIPVTNAGAASATPPKAVPNVSFPIPIPIPVPIPDPVPASASAAVPLAAPMASDTNQVPAAAAASAAAVPPAPVPQHPDQQQQPPEAGSQPSPQGAPALSTSAPLPQAQPSQATPAQPLPQSVMPAGPPGGSPVPSTAGPVSGPAMAPPMPPGAGAPPMGPLPPSAIHGPMPTLGPGPPPPAIMGHMPPHIGPSGQVGGPRPPGPAPGPPHPYMQINGAMAVPMAAPGGPMQPVAKQMQLPPPPPGTMLMPMGGHPGGRPPMPGPGMPVLPGGPQVQPGMQVPPPPPQQSGPMVRPPGGPMVQQGPIPGMPGQGPHGGMVPVPHPQGTGQPPHGQPPGGAPRGPGPQGQPMMMPPMQFAGSMHGGAMPLPHGQPPNGPMGHIPPGVYVFPPGAPGMVPPGAPGQLPPHPHMHYVLPAGVSMPMGGPPPLHMQPPGPPQQQPQQPQPHQQGSSQAPPMVPAGPQPPPPPKSPSAAAGTGSGKPGSTLNANARSFVPSGKAAAAAAGTSASGAQAQQQQQGQAQGQGQQQVQSGGSGPQAAQAQRQQYQRHSSGGLGDAGGGAMQGPTQQQAPGFQRGGPGGPYLGQGQQAGPGGGQYGNRRDRRELPRGGAGAGTGGGRKGPVLSPAGPHGAGPVHGDMASMPMVPPPPHPHGGPHPIQWMGAPMAGGMPIPPPPAPPHGPGLEGPDSKASISPAGPLERQMQEVSDSSTDDVGRPAPADVGPPMPVLAHQPMPGPGLVHPGHGPGTQHPMMPPPPGMAPPPPGHGAPRVMLMMQPGMPGPMTVPVPMAVPMHPMMPVHMMHPVAVGPAPGPTDGPVQKNGSAAESVRAPQPAQQLEEAPALTEAGSEGTHGGKDSAAEASATAQNDQDSNGDSTAAGAPRPDGGDKVDSAAALADSSSAATAGSTAAGPSSDSAASWKAVAGAAESRPANASTAAGAGLREAGGVANSNGTGDHQRQSHGRGSATAGGPQTTASLPGRGTATPGQQQPSTAQAPMSWSSVAAASRREISGGATAASPGSYSQEAFPSLGSGPASAAASVTVMDPSQQHPAPAAGSSWKAKLQQNVQQQQQLQQQVVLGPGGAQKAGAPATANGGSPHTSNGVRGSSPRGTLSGGVQLASSLSDSAIAHGGASSGHANGPVPAAVVALPPRHSGNPPSGAALLSGPPSQLVGSLSVPSQSATGAGGVVYHPGVGGEPRPLLFVRGLQNLGGQHNCFLNVTIQSLWHLCSFREALLLANMDEVAARGAPAADVAVMRALADVFHAMTAPPSIPASSVGAPEQPPAASASWAVSPLALREALSLLETGQAAVRLDLSEMHDAFEVLLVLLTCLHQAEAGSGAAHGQDPQLPRRVRVKDILAGRCPSGKSGAAARQNGQHRAAAPTGYAAAVAGSQQQPQRSNKVGPPSELEYGPTGVPRTAAHSLFGLEVQVPCAAEEDDDSSTGSSGASRQQNRVGRESGGGTASSLDAAAGSPAVSQAAPQGRAVAAGASGIGGGLSNGNVPGGRAAGDEGSAEVEVYTKYFHLVHAQALRTAYAALDGADSGAYFEDVLCAAEAAGTAHSSSVLGVANGTTGGSSSGTRRAASASSAGAATLASTAPGVANGGGPRHGGWVPGATAAAHPLATLLRFPTVFTLALVWESPQAPIDALRGTLEALGPRVDLALLFRSSRVGSGPVAPSTPCELRSVICYFGHHYLVFALSEELNLWLLIDDANIQLVGLWGDVVKVMCAKRLQPSLLFYEATKPAQQGGAP